MEIDKRILKGNKCYFGLGYILCSRTISRNLKIQMYVTFICQIVLHASETWPLSKVKELRLNVFERKMLIIIYGLIIGT